MVMNTKSVKRMASADRAGVRKAAPQSWVKGAAILAVGGFIAKLLGAIYRIPLTNLIGAEGMGLYQMIFPMYSLLLTVSSGGIPTALARLVAEKTARGDLADAGRTARSALCSLAVLGIAASGLVALCAPRLAAAQGNADAAAAYYAVSPAIAFVAVISALRGYFQGKENMTPSAVSQIVEQIVKLACGLGFAVLLLPRGTAYAAAGAAAGVTVSEAVAAAVLAIQLACDRTRLPVAKTKRFLRDTRELYAIAIPVTLGGAVMPLTMLIDSAVVINILKRTVDVSTATALYGLSGGPVGSLINMPVVLSLALGTAILPGVAASHTTGDETAVRQKAGLCFRLAIYVAAPCSAAFALFARPLIELLYGRGLAVGVVDEAAVAGNLLAAMSGTVLLLALIQISTSMLHAIGKNYVPVVNLALGAAVKLALNIVLLPVLGIYAVAVSNLGCYAAACVLDLVALVRFVRPALRLREIGGILLATAFVSAFGCGAYRLFLLWIPSVWACVSALVLAAAAYILLSLAFGAFSSREIAHIPVLRQLFVRGKSRRHPSKSCQTPPNPLY